MGLFYNEIKVTPDGILTLQEFPTPFDGRMVKFDIPGGYLRKELYIISDDAMMGPYTRPSPVQTNVSGLEILRRSCHCSTVAVVDLAERELPDLRISPTPVSVHLNSGENASVKISGTMKVTACVERSDLLMKDYMEKHIASAESYVMQLLRGWFEYHLIKTVHSCFSRTDIMEALAEVDRLSACIADSVVDDAQKQCPWLRVIGRRCSLVVENQVELQEKSNYAWSKAEQRDELSFHEQMRLHSLEQESKIRQETKRAETELEIRKMTVDAILQVYGAEPIPRSIMEAVAHWLAGNPGVMPNELVDVISKLRNISKQIPPDQILTAVKRLSEKTTK